MQLSIKDPRFLKNSDRITISTLFGLGCNICKRKKEETEYGRLVRDHNHETMMIRGILCDRCNYYLGVIEHCLVNGYGNKLETKYRVWVSDYKDAINKHLQGNTGIKFIPSRKRSREFRDFKSL